MNTTFFLNCVAGNLFGSKTSPALPTEYYIGLSTSAPVIDGTGVTEPMAEDGYARVKLTALGEPVDGVVSNTGTISFPESEKSWGTVTHFVVYDGLADGNLLMYGPLNTPRMVEPQTTMIIKPGFLKLSLQNPTE